MALVTSPLGKITQSIDNLNFRTWKDKNVIARRVTTSNQPNTPLQVAQKQKFGAVVAISRVLLPAIRIGFKSMAKSMTEANVFISQNTKKLGWDAVAAKLTGMVGLVIAKGSLLAPANFNVNTDNGADIKFTWADNSDGVAAMATDRLVLAMLDQVSGKATVLQTGATRSQATFTAAGAQAEFPGAEMIISAFFVAADGRSVSDNVNKAIIIL